jgi:hypothetical protein
MIQKNKHSTHREIYKIEVVCLNPLKPQVKIPLKIQIMRKDEAV